MVNTVSKTGKDDADSSMCVLSKQIKEEARKMPHSKNEYNVIENENLMDEFSETLMTPIFEKSLPAVMIGNIVTSVVTKHFTKLQLAFSVLGSDRKWIEHFHEYGITPTYQEFQRFKVSAAGSSDNNDKEVRARDGLIQIVADNFDAHIHFQNGLKETHNIATIIAQPTHKYEPSKTPIPRLKQENLKSVELKETDMKYFKGLKNPPMPESFCKYEILRLKILCNQAVR